MKQSPIFVKTYDLLVWLLGRTGNFSKNERFRMAKRVEDSAFAFHDLLLQAGRLSKERREEKRRLLSRSDVELDRLRFAIRLCRDLQLISFKQYEYCAERLVEIGRLLGGWHKSLA